MPRQPAQLVAPGHQRPFDLHLEAVPVGVDPDERERPQKPLIEMEQVGVGPVSPDLHAVAQVHGANIILPRGQVVLFDDKMNLTKEIIALMDKALPAVDFPAPQIEAEPQQPQQPAQPQPKKKN